MSVDYNDDLRDMVLFDEGSPLPLDSLPKEPEDAAGSSIVCHPTEILKSKREEQRNSQSPRLSPMSIGALLQPSRPPSPTHSAHRPPPSKSPVSNVSLPSITGMFGKRFMDPVSVNPFIAPSTPVYTHALFNSIKTTPNRNSSYQCKPEQASDDHFQEEGASQSTGRLRPATFDPIPPYLRPSTQNDSSDDESMDDLFGNLPPRGEFLLHFHYVPCILVFSHTNKI